MMDESRTSQPPGFSLPQQPLPGSCLPPSPLPALILPSSPLLSSSEPLSPPHGSFYLHRHVANTWLFVVSVSTIRLFFASTWLFFYPRRHVVTNWLLFYPRRHYLALFPSVSTICMAVLRLCSSHLALLCLSSRQAARLRHPQCQLSTRLPRGDVHVSNEMLPSTRLHHHHHVHPGQEEPRRYRPHAVRSAITATAELV